jgi:hypothetical protein
MASWTAFAAPGTGMTRRRSTARGRTEIERNHAFIFSTFLKDSRWTESQAEI